jgi:putative two-component system response regulator
MGEMIIMEQITKQTILIVDDEPANIKILLELLRSEYQTRVANNGEKALQIMFSDDRPDLILLDIMMPGMDGYEVCQGLKADDRTKEVPIIFITAKVTEKDELKAFELGAVDYITKPFSTVVVKARVKTHLKLKQQRDFLEAMLKERTKTVQEIVTNYSHIFYRK